MDPEETFRRLLAARADHDWDQAEELAHALLEWLQKRGFPPQTIGHEKLGRGWHRAVATFVCYLVLGDVNRVRDRCERRRTQG